MDLFEKHRRPPAVEKMPREILSLPPHKGYVDPHLKALADHKERAAQVKIARKSAMALVRETFDQQREAEKNFSAGTAGHRARAHRNYENETF